LKIKNVVTTIRNAIIGDIMGAYSDNSGIINSSLKKIYICLLVKGKYMGLSIIVLAAGQSRRFVSSTSKVMHKIAGKEIISFVNDITKKIRHEQLVYIVNEQNIFDIKKIAPSAHFLIQVEQNGTGGAVKIALNDIPTTGTSLILYGDTPFLSLDSINKMLELMKNNGDAGIVILAAKIEKPNKYGRIFLHKTGEKVEKLIEFSDCDQEQLKNNICNSGIMLIRNEYLHSFLPMIKNNNLQNEYYLTDIVNLAASHNVKTYHVMIEETEMIGINSREELAEAENIWQNRKRIEFLEHGVTMIDPKTVYFSYDTKIGHDVIIEPSVYFGEGVEIESGCTIRSFSHITGTKIASASSIGPFARIRPGTVIGENVKIGNFVELKNSKIANKVKIGHLSYIGDADIGENANLGAGSITCNYDGIAHKNVTRVGKNVSIGSNCSLIAPIQIGDNAIIGAGSVVTENVATNELAIGRSRQINFEGKALEIRLKKG